MTLNFLKFHFVFADWQFFCVFCLTGLFLAGIFYDFKSCVHVAVFLYFSKSFADCRTQKQCKNLWLRTGDMIFICDAFVFFYCIILQRQKVLQNISLGFFFPFYFV